MSFVDHFLDWAHRGLLESDEGQAYLHSRGASRGQWERHRLGFTVGDFFADPSRDDGHSDACADREQRSLRCDSCKYNRWSTLWDERKDDSPRVVHVGRRILGSVVLPLTNYAGMAVGFQVRSIKEKSYDTFVVKRHPEGYFFGVGPNMEAIWRSSEIWLVEGPLDALVFERLTASNVVALATNAVGPAQARFLRRFVRRVNLLLDLDDAGRKGVRSFLHNLGQHFDVRDVRCPVPYGMTVKEVKDPGDLWRVSGDDGFRKRMANAILEAGS